MPSSKTKTSVSRRTALAGLGAGGLGIALTAARGAAAQDAATDLAVHPIVGAWQPVGDPATPDDRSFIAFHSDGTFTTVHAIAGPGIGVWRATGERTGELTAKGVNNSFDAGQYQAGTNTMWVTFEVAADGKSFTGPMTVALTNPDGSYFAGFEAVMNATRLEVESRPSIESVKAGTPTS